MLLYARIPVTRRYAVEVSGWDSEEVFFVEKCELDWNEETGKQVALSRELSGSSVMLVRLLQPGNSDRSHPVVYEAELLEKLKSGRHQFRLHPVVLRQREEESSAA